MIYASYSELSKELKNSTKIKVGQVVFELLIQNQHFDCFDLQLKKPLGLLKFQCHFWVPWTIFYKMHMLFIKKVLIILRYSTKHANFW